MANSEHKLIQGDGTWLAFARSCVKRLRAAGIAYGAQKVIMPDGAAVRVRIAPGHDYISIEANSPMDYSVWPTNQQSLQGVIEKGVPPDTVSISPLAKLSLKPIIKIKENTPAVTGKHDWVDDKHSKVITYDHGEEFRYRNDRGGIHNLGYQGIYMGGVKVDTEYSVKGAAVFKYSYIDSENKTITGSKIIYAAYNLHQDSNFNIVGPNVMSLMYLGPPDAAGARASIEFARYTVPTPTYIPGTPGQIISQPTYFSGIGDKLVTALTTIVTTNLGGNLFYDPVNPRYIVNGTVSIDSQGVLSATFSEVARIPSESYSNRATTSVSPPQSPGYGRSTWGNAAFPYYSVDPPEVPYEPPLYEARPTSGGLVRNYTYSSSEKTESRVITFFGVDMTPSGAVMTIERAGYTEATSTSLQTRKSDHSWAMSWRYVNLTWYFRWSFITTVTTETDTFTGGTATYDAFLSDGVEIFRIDKTSVVNYSSGVTTSGQTANYTHTGSEENADLVASIAYVPISGSGSTVTTTANNYFISIRDIDFRLPAVAYTQTKYNPAAASHQSKPITMKLRIDTGIIGVGNKEKTIFTGNILPQNQYPQYMNSDYYMYKVFASKRPKEFVACFSPTTVSHAGNTANNSFEMLNFLATNSATDRAPLFVVLKNGALVTDLPEKFSLGKAPVPPPIVPLALRIDPIHLL